MAEMGGRQAAMKEINNHLQGRSGSKAPEKAGPAVGKTSGNSTKGGGINRKTQGRR